MELRSSGSNYYRVDGLNFLTNEATKFAKNNIAVRQSLNSLQIRFKNTNQLSVRFIEISQIFELT
jgi:hypothetical protein